jgi:2-(1,2-epoxy-1,2-dihydrophenyl)acetyl-CoA isomerase
VLLGQRQRFGDGKRSAHIGLTESDGTAPFEASTSTHPAERLAGFWPDSWAGLLDFEVMESVLLSEREGPVLTLIMNRPQTKNALDPELLLALGAGLADASADASVLAVVLTGAGDAFCSGADLKGALGDLDAGADLGPRIAQFHALIRAIVHAPKPFIAAVRGPAVGFGADLALACDLRVFAPDAYIQEKFVGIGLMPDGGGSFWLPRLVGMGRALEYLLLGTRIDAAHAQSLGLANRVADDARAVAQTLAATLAAGPPLALAAIKNAVRQSSDGGIEAALEREKLGQTALLGSRDFREGLAAWAAKRRPEFSGK